MEKWANKEEKISPTWIQIHLLLGLGYFGYPKASLISDDEEEEYIYAYNYEVGLDVKNHTLMVYK